MNNPEYSHLNFNRPLRRIPARAAAVGVTLTLFSLAWAILPSSGMFWLLLITLGAAVWVASFGWRTALTVLIDYLHRLERL